MELATFIFGLSSQGESLGEWGKGPSIVDADFLKNRDECLTILNNSLCYNGLDSLDGLDATPLDLVSGVHKGSAHGSYLTLLMLGALISVKNFLSLARSHPELPPVVGLNIASLEIYL